MEEKNSIKINLITIFLIISLMINFIIGFFIYKLYNDKQIVDSKLTDLNNKVDKLENVVDNLQSTETLTTKEDYETIDINNYIFELDSKDKYIIVTDSKWLTMLNDGGSNTSIYYQIDLDNNIISKVQEDYKANLLEGTPSTKTNVIYIKKIDTNIQKEVRALLTEIISKEDINDSNNYHPFTISTLNTEKVIYNKNTIESINVLLKKMDELK